MTEKCILILSIWKTGPTEVHYVQRARTVQLGYITTGLDMTLQYNIFTIWRLQAVSGAKYTFYN